MTTSIILKKYTNLESLPSKLKFFGNLWLRTLILMAYEKETEVPRKYSLPGESVMREDPVHLINGLFEVDKKLKKLVIKVCQMVNLCYISCYFESHWSFYH